MELTVTSGLQELKSLTVAAQDKHVVPLQQDMAQLRAALVQGGPLDKAQEDRLAKMADHAEYLCYIHEKMRQRIDDMFRWVGRPSHPAGELLSNEPHAFKALS